MKFDKKNTLKKLVNLLREADEVKKEDGEDSLDSQLDRYFSDYESEAKNSKNEGLSLRSITKRLLEEEGDEEGEDEDSEEEEEKLSTEDLDIKSFVSSVMRLVDNYDNLLEINNTILRRAANFIGKVYDETTVQAFKDELIESYGVEIGKSKLEKEDEFEAPKAGAAGPMGGSGA